MIKNTLPNKLGNPKSLPFEVKNRNTRTMCEICSKLTIKAIERCHLLLTLKKHRVGNFTRKSGDIFHENSCN